MSRHGKSIASERVVLRVMSPKPRFEPKDGHAVPEAFEPNTGDKNAAKKRNEPVRVSVWDDSETSLEQVMSFRDLKEVRPYYLPVTRALELRSLAVYERLKIVYDDVGEEDRNKPGADGHGGIEGLDRNPKEGFLEHMDRLALLADRAKTQRPT